MATLTGNVHSFLAVPAHAVLYRVKTLGESIVVGSHIVTTGERRFFTGADGSFSATLEAGSYEFTFNAVDRFTVSVPNDGATYPFLDRVTSNITQPSPPSGGSSWPAFPEGSDWMLLADGRLVAKSRSSGLFHTVYVTGPQDEPELVIMPGTLTP
ncbi:MAG: hypothetical protein KIT22_07910 [Verrucomicrobiae bacterium]|nr:hypothetical protein [Verrucomicrobiae bacterium]